MLRTLTATALGLLLLSSGAAAQAPCGIHDDMVGHLAKKYGEARIAVGLDAQGRMLEVLTSENGTWSIVVTTPGGPSCLVVAGESWQSVAKVAMAPEL